jgi:hypothetical protein
MDMIHPVLQQLVLDRLRVRLGAFLGFTKSLACRPFHARGSQQIDMTSRGPRSILFQYPVQGLGLSLLAAYPIPMISRDDLSASYA